MQLPPVLCCCVVLLWWSVPARADGGEDLATTEHQLERTKRWLNYPINGGLAKIVLGFVVPIKFYHPLPRVIVNTYNLQASYRIPATIIYPYPESVFQNRAQQAGAGWSRAGASGASGLPSELRSDRSRQQLFALLERSWSGWRGRGKGRDGRACLLRAVCEVAETPLKHNGLIGEIIDVIFTPSPTDELDPKYEQAMKQGKEGGDCIKLNPGCPIGHGFFDSVSMLSLPQ